VGEGEETVELEAEPAAQLFAVACLELRLRRRQEGADRVVDEVEPLLCPVAERVQAPERRDALIERPVPALAVHVLRAVARQARDHLDPVFGEELGQILHPGLEDRKSTRLNSSHVAISYAV